MDKPLSNWLRNLFLAHWIIGALLGAALFLVPGRSLILLGWVPQWVQLPGGDLTVPGSTFVDATLIRLLGAALLALAWSSFRSWRAKQRSEVEPVIQIEAVFCILGTIACIAGLIMLDRVIPVIGYITTLILLLFALGWSLALLRK